MKNNEHLLGSFILTSLPYVPTAKGLHGSKPPAEPSVSSKCIVKFDYCCPPVYPENSGKKR